MELNRAAYEADATRHRTSIRRLTARIRTASYPVPAIFELIQKSGDIPVRDMYNTFNMGIGLVIAIPKDQVGHALDVLARAELWDVIRALKGRITVILTTHYMEEAEALSDRVGVMKDGRLLALGTPEELKAQTGCEKFEEAFIAIVKGAGK